MARQAMERAFSDLPERSSGGLTGAKSFLLDLADDVSEDIVGIMCASPNVNGNSALVVTPNRIIEMTSGGSLQVLAYSELSSVQAVGGAKKRFGRGYETIYLRVGSLQGGMRTYPLFGDYEWNSRVSADAESAFNKYRLKSSI
jgi:hypothetical protein